MIVEDDIVEQTESLTLAVGAVDQGVGGQSIEVVIRDDDSECKGWSGSVMPLSCYVCIGRYNT